MNGDVRDPDDTLSQSGLPPLAIPDSLATFRAPTDWGAATSVGRVRAQNDDRWGHIGHTVFVVADGMGGYAGGDRAAMAAVEGFVTAAQSGPAQPEGWLEVIRRVNKSVAADLAALEIDRGGTTLVGAIFEDDVLTLVHVGDSRAYRLRESRLGLLTTDHTLLGEMQAIGMAQAPGDAGPMAKGLTSYLGIADDLLRVDVQRLDIREDDLLVLCSDGVHGQVPPETMSNIMGAAESAESIARALVSEADVCGGRDNATAIAIRV